MQVNKSKIVDWLLNGWEHDFLSDVGGSEQHRIESVCDYLLEDVDNVDQKTRRKIEEMVTHWVNNTDNDRLTITMNIHQSHELVMVYINKFLK